MSISLSRLRSFYRDFTTPLLLHAMVKQEFPGSIAMVTTFEEGSARLLPFLAGISSNIPILFEKTDRTTHEANKWRTEFKNLNGHSPGASRNSQNDITAPFHFIIEENGYLAIITERDAVTANEVIELNNEGVFIINPLVIKSVIPALQSEASDWSV